MCSRSFAIALALVAMSGCKLAESEPALRLVAVRPASNVAPIVRVETSGVDRAHLFVDGLELPGTVPVGQEVPVRLPTAGAHRVHARVYRGTSAQDSAPLDLTLDVTAPSVTFSPPEGRVYSTEPFTVTAMFDDPLDPATVTGETVTLISNATRGPVPTVVTLSPDGRRIEIRADTDLAALKYVSLRLAVRDLAGNRVSEDRSWWTAEVECSWQISRAEVSGTAQIGASWQYGPGVLTVLLDGNPIGTVTPGGSLAWDTTTVPDGSHALTLSGPGWLVHSPPFTLSVRNAPPALLGCSVSATAPSSFLVEARFDQPVRYVGDSATSTCRQAAPDLIACRPAQTVPALPGPWTLDVTSSVTNLALVPPAQPQRCTVELPSWRAPFGEGPIRSATAALGPEIVGARSILAPAYAVLPDSLQIVRRSLAGDATPGRIELLEAQGTQPLALADTLVESGATAVRAHSDPNGVSLLWLEPAAGGGVAIRTRTGTPVTRPVNAGVQLVRTFDGFAQAWTELDNGRRVFRMIAWDEWHRIDVLTPPANVAPDGSVVAAAASWYDIALVETGADGVARLYVRSFEPRPTQPEGWITIGGILNADPAASASEPAVGDDGGSSYAPFVAWIEGGRVLAREWDSASGAWSAPLPLSDGRAGVTVRSPVIAGPKVVFVERENGVDRFVFHRRGSVYTGDPGFHPMPPLETGGLVTDFTVSPDPLTISWTDDAGAVRVRVAVQ